MNEQSKTSAPATPEQSIATTPPEQIIHIPYQADPLLDVKAELERLKADVDMWREVPTLAIRLTKERHWIRQGEGGFYLQDFGTQIIADAFGIDYSIIGSPVREDRSDANGHYYLYLVKVKAFSRKLGRYLDDEGSASSRDGFFGRAGGILKKIENVDELMIRKKAIANAYNRLGRRMLGLMAVDEAMLKEAGLDPTKIGKVDYATGSQKGSTAVPQEALDKRAQIWTMCLALCGGDDAKAKKFLGDATQFKGDGGHDQYNDKYPQGY